MFEMSIQPSNGLELKGTVLTDSVQTERAHRALQLKAPHHLSHP